MSKAKIKKNDQTNGMYINWSSKSGLGEFIFVQPLWKTP